MTRFPASGRLAWWGTAWLRGEVGPDELLDGVLGTDVTHVVVGGDGGGALLATLVAARRAGATEVAAALPRPGDLWGLRGPGELNTSAVDAGEAALLLGAGQALVPARVGPVVEWTLLPAERRTPPDLGEADRDLRGTLLRAANGLAELDVARWAPEVADELIDLRSCEELPAPRGVPRRCVDLAGRALRLRQVAELALDAHGAALNATQTERRRVVLDDLERSARHALAAACSPDGWPPR